jgi:hypothetical protein
MVKRIYLETTMFNFPFAEKGKQYYGKTIRYCQEAKKVFEILRTGKFEPYTSGYVTVEHRYEMLQLVTDSGATVLPKTNEIERLACLYINAGAIPETFPDDARHIACTAIHGLDFIVSLNFQHIVKDRVIAITARIHQAEGYAHIQIFEPEEFIQYDANN